MFVFLLFESNPSKAKPPKVTSPNGVCLLFEGRRSRVESKWSRVEGNKSRVEKLLIIFERRQIKISYRPLFTRVFGACFMYQSNRSFNILPQATPRAFEFLENICSNSPVPGPKSCSNTPPLGPFQVIPTPGEISTLLINSAQRISSFTGTWLKESRLRRLQLLNKT